MADTLKLAPPHAQGQFVSTASAKALDDDPNVRKFFGDGTNHLVIPGIQEIERVWIGSTEIPLFEKLEFPADGSEKPRMWVHNHQMLAIDRTSEGNTVLLRSERSNDGIWQKDQPIYIKGTWKDKKAA